MHLRTIHQFVIDRSSAALFHAEEITAAINHQLDCLRQQAAHQPDEEHFVNIAIFNERLREVFVLQRPGYVNNLSLADFRYEGCCALYDALDLLHTRLKKQLLALNEEVPTVVKVMIFSHGPDNASFICNQAQISKRLNKLSMSNIWTFHGVDAICGLFPFVKPLPDTGLCPAT